MSQRKLRFDLTWHFIGFPKLLHLQIWKTGMAIQRNWPGFITGKTSWNFYSSISVWRKKIDLRQETFVLSVHIELMTKTKKINNSASKIPIQVPQHFWSNLTNKIFEYAEQLTKLFSLQLSTFPMLKLNWFVENSFITDGFSICQY